MLTTRRQALKTLAASTVATSIGSFPLLTQAAPASATPPAASAPTGPFTLPPLPYAYDALEPHIDTETMHLHHDKHHAAYVAKLNEAVARINATRKGPSGPPPITAGTDVYDLLSNLSQLGGSTADCMAVKNQGGGHYNHSLLWQTLSAKSGAPKGELAKALDSDLGGLDKFKAEASKAGAGLFGSGWVWLVLNSSKKLEITTTVNQDIPSADNGEHPYQLFGIDVWEHAYYLKYHNVRADYIKAIWNVVNWDFISDRYAKAMKG